MNVQAMIDVASCVSAEVCIRNREELYENISRDGA